MACTPRPYSGRLEGPGDEVRRAAPETAAVAARCAAIAARFAVDEEQVVARRVVTPGGCRFDAGRPPHAAIAQWQGTRLSTGRQGFDSPWRRHFFYQTVVSA